MSHAGLVLLRRLCDVTGLAGGLSRALGSSRLLVHDRGRVTADLACAIADGGEVISDFRVIGDQSGLFGPVASVPTVWRTLNEIAAGGQATLDRMAAAVNAARRRAWAGVVSRHGGLPGVRITDRVLDGGELHPDRRHGHRGAFGQGVGRTELQGLRAPSAAVLL